MSTIELGEISPAHDGPDPVGSPRFDRRLVRQTGLGLIAALCLAGLAGSHVPEPLGVRPVWSISIAQAQGTTLTSDGVFVHRSVNGLAAVTAYDLPTGAVRWQRPFDTTIGYLQAAESAGMLLVPTEGHVVELPAVNEQSAFHAEFHRQTIAISTATGAELWRTAGEPYTVSGETALLTEYTDRADLARMRLIRLSDHSTIWRRDTPGVGNYTVIPGDRPDKIITATGAGVINIYSYATGELISTAKVPWVKGNPDEGYFNDLSGTRDVLVVNRSRRELFDMSVYRADTMTELWRAPDTNGYAFPCGSALCLNDGAGLVAYDPLTGERRWRLDGAVNAFQVTPDRLVLGEGLDDGRNVLVDAETGAALGEPAFGTLAWSAPDEASVLVLRSTVSPPDRTAVIRWDLRTGRQRMLGTIGAMAGRPCSSVPGYLVCTVGDDYQVVAVR
ncbi:outer membrane protein assembly factor BamB family protein [Paractinoplanes lichenicola]|uniref:PQQ-binding-like beta-propeller repeat protein n=1 Tax=Paractinoplanes lichenicola TaxID=2802976 RepID=A0ABS1VLN8_9ACTN|nr:PQQ-binding-like beta-propeller repeat protein [Actinoplanes lichenicola]MBL7255135.1 PQQ-binding-like beta-propeller repeat protein [Actinoplanes lichenicola]